MKVLELLLSDPEYYAATTEDPMGEVIEPWAEWINEVMVQDQDTGEECWFTPHTPAPAHLMRHAKWVDYEPTNEA